MVIKMIVGDVFRAALHQWSNWQKQNVVLS